MGCGIVFLGLRSTKRAVASNILYHIVQETEQSKSLSTIVIDLHRMASVGSSKGFLLAATLSAAIIAGLFVFSRKGSIPSAVPGAATLPAFVPTERGLSSRLLVVTRIHVSSAQSLSPPSAVTSFAKSALEYADSVLICVSKKYVCYQQVSILTFVRSDRSVLTKMVAIPTSQI